MKKLTQRQYDSFRAYVLQQQMFIRPDDDFDELYESNNADQQVGDEPDNDAVDSMYALSLLAALEEIKRLRADLVRD